MPAPKTIEPPADFLDPRLAPRFAPEHWPSCNGQPAPLPGARDLHDRRCLEFLALYYRLNVLQARLLVARRKSLARKTIQSILSQIDQAAVALENLEDRYAPIGLFGEPSMDGLFYRDIAFVRPELPRIFPQPASQCSHVAIPGLEDIPASELRGPVLILRFRHGQRKMDL